MDIRDGLEDDTTFKPIIEDGIRITAEKDVFENWIKNVYQRWKESKVPDLSQDYPIGECRIIVYTNASVNYYNKIVRNVLGYPHHEMIVGDFLMGYTNLGYPEHIIENGQDYIVKKIVDVTDHVIMAQKKFDGLVGKMVNIREMDDSSAKIHEVFMPDIDDESNYDIIMELYYLAKKVNQKNSTKNDFRQYSTLRYQMVFNENVFNFGGAIDKESSFKETHPLLFTSTLEIMSDQRELFSGNKCQDIDGRYPGLRQLRKEDDKGLSETEHLADMFQILEKDVDYGYSITCHKSQGSSYEECFVDDTEFDKIKDRWSIRHNRKESRIREKNQLRYVAYTRPRNRLNVLTKL
jgi:hypothetical protein